MSTVDVVVDRETYTELTVEHPPTAVTRGIRYVLEESDVVIEYADTDAGVRAVTGPSRGTTGFAVEFEVLAEDDDGTTVRIQTDEQDSVRWAFGYSKPPADAHDQVVGMVRDVLDAPSPPTPESIEKRLDDVDALYHPTDRDRVMPVLLLAVGFVGTIVFAPIAIDIQLTFLGMGPAILAVTPLFVGIALMIAYHRYEIRQIRR